uniref:C-C motif chemokine 4-like n=1 Tax=Gouania willdenowi TaxID=441366 RepID=A0A8C5HVK9_GOUWI
PEMKTLVIVLAFLLAFSSNTVLAQNSFGPSTCCFFFKNGPLKKANVISYTYTSSLCSMDGVLNGAEICVDPSMKWVKKIIEENLTPLIAGVTNMMPAGPR